MKFLITFDSKYCPEFSIEISTKNLEDAERVVDFLSREWGDCLSYNVTETNK